MAVKSVGRKSKKVTTKKKGTSKSSFHGIKAKEERKLTVDKGESEMVVTGEMTTPSSKKGSYRKEGDRMDIWMGLEYFFGIFGGLAAYALKMANQEVEEKYLKAANEAIVYGIAIIIFGVVVSAITLGIGSIVPLLVSFYVAYKKAEDSNYEIPYITEFTRKNVPYKG